MPVYVAQFNKLAVAQNGGVPQAMQFPPNAAISTLTVGAPASLVLEDDTTMVLMWGDEVFQFNIGQTADALADGMPMPANVLITPGVNGGDTVSVSDGSTPAP